MYARILAASIAAAVLWQSAPASANDLFWTGNSNTNWADGTNWYTPLAPGTPFVPRASGGFNLRAIIGTDNPNGLLDTTQGLSPVISAPLPAVNQEIGGLYLGLRELTYTTSPPSLVNPDPAPGALVGALTITAGSLTNIATANAGVGADGRIVVGADGRGYLTMTGGTLIGEQLLVGGEEISTGLGTSLIDLSGSSTLHVDNPVASNGSATFNRRLRIEGPNVDFNATGTIRLNGSNTYTAVITDASAHSALKSDAAAIVSGALNVEFSGAGAVGHSIGDSWTLVDAALALAGNFNNLGPGGTIVPQGLVGPTPTGAVYRVAAGESGGRKTLDLKYDAVLVLEVNRDTGEMSITNPLTGAIDIAAYSINSSGGSLLTGYTGISGNPPPSSPTFIKAGLSANALTEFVDPTSGNDSLDFSGGAPVGLGTGFDGFAIAADVANFGTDGEDLVFTYSTPGSPFIQQGQVVYTGTKFENDLVLRVNPNTGEAFLKNDSQVTLVFDGYAIKSETGDLSGAGFTGLGSGWVTSPTGSDSLTQTNLSGATTLAPGAEMAIGDISATGFASDAAQDGLSLEFILAESLIAASVGGDYNSDGVVDAADYTVFRDNDGANITLPNENPEALTPGVVDQEDYDYWAAQYGSVGGFLPETEFRIGSVFFDPTAGSSFSAAVPEPSSAAAVLLGAVSLLAGRSRVRRRSEGRYVTTHKEASSMATTTRTTWKGAVVAAVALFVAAPALAVTQGITLTNNDFELPGPVGTKTIAFNPDGTPNGAIPGWTLPGPGVENFGHEEEFGDSSTNGGGNPGNVLELSTLDGVAYQTSAFNAVSIPATQQYKLSFDAHDVFTIDAAEQQFETSQNELTARLYYLEADNTTRTTIGSPLVLSGLPVEYDTYTIGIPGDSPSLAAALGRPLGVEFDVTSDEFNPLVAHSWAGIDNVVLQISGVLEGDLNGDGSVDGGDYNIVVNGQQQSSFFNADGEVTGDGFVDLQDFRAIKNLIAAAGNSHTIPEPTSVAMLLVAAAALLGGARRVAKPVAIAGVCLTAAIGSSAKAELFAYDPFEIGASPAAGEYTAGPLAGQNPTIGESTPFFDGAWVQQAGVEPGQVMIAPGLSYLGAEAAGGSAAVAPNETTFATDTRVGRYLADPWDNTTEGTFYVGWLQNFGDIPGGVGDMGFRSASFWNNGGAVGNDGDLTGYIAYNAYFSTFDEPTGSQQRNPASARMIFNFGGEHQIIENSPASFNEDGVTHLIVLKFDLSAEAGSDAISVYLDPVSLTEPDLPGASATGLDLTLGSLGFAQFGGAGSLLNEYDELRIADTFAEALPPLPLPGDTDNDGDVDLDDYQNIIANMNQDVSSALEGDVARADGTQGSDGRVTIADYHLWYQNRTDLGSSAAVPEPASALIALLAAGAALPRRR